MLRLAARTLGAGGRQLSTKAGGSAGSMGGYLLAGTGAALGATALVASGVIGTHAQTSADSAGDGAKVAAMEKRLSQLEVEVAGGRQMALVFIKPHACNPKVIELVRAKLAAAGIRITSEGTIGAEQIDKQGLIDNHYGAIAAKAVKLKPSQLSVPAKGKAEFAKLFGMTWEEALKKGVVYNAADAAAKLQGAGTELEKRWSTLSRTTELLKFGGGFYVGKLGEDMFVINGFYMSMRLGYTTPPAQLHYFTVQWPTERLTWAAFRSEVLGSTNPADAAKGSVRRQILDEWEKLGLASQPNVGENGVHASASPFEALAERMNWTGVALTADQYGRGLLSAGIPAEMIVQWTEDPQVTLNGKKGSLFDFLEDRDADDVLATVTQISVA